MSDETNDKSSRSGMGGGAKIAIVAILAAAVVAVVVIKSREGSKPNAEQNASANHSGGRKLPKLLDLGAGKCVPCKLMAPILDELKEEYQGRFEVVFIDVWKDPEAGKKYKVRSIPTQVFYDAEGKELFRHLGFYSRDDILTKWKELGFDFGKAGTH
jgi:thioredoxin